MNIFFKFIFERLTDPLGLPINIIYEYLILAVISEIAFRVAFGLVGDMYHMDMIEGRISGSFFHWFFRLIIFVIMWAVTYGAIWLYRFISANWQLVVMVLFSVLGAAMLCTLVIGTMRLVKKHRTVNGNA